MKNTAAALTLLFQFFLLTQVIAQHPRLAIHSYATRAENGPSKKGKYSIDQFIGRWQETARMRSKTKEATEVVDTFYIHFYKNNTADTREGNSQVITGSAEVFTDNYITTSATDFRIISVNHDVIVLDDMIGYLHSMSRVNSFSYEAGNNPTIVGAAIPDNKIDLSPSSIIKNWFAYRRSANPGFANAGTPLLRNLRIQEKISADSYKAEVEFSRNGIAYVQPCTLLFAGKKLTINTEGSNWNVEVYKADGQELILGKIGELVYYFKNLDR